MERHCVRLFRIAERMGEGLPGEADREVLLCAAYLHDAGLFPGVKSDDVYVTDGRRLAERVLAPFAWEPERLRRCLDAIELHHETRAQWDLGPEVELTRRADLVDVTRGLVRFGVPRAWLRSLFRRRTARRDLSDARPRGRSHGPRAPADAAAHLQPAAGERTRDPRL